MPYPPVFELLKRVAFAAMLVDHVDMLLLERSQPWMWAIGRVAFPVFVFTFCFGLAYSRDVVRVGLRVLGVALLAQLVWQWASPGYGANVLFVMALGALAALGSVASPLPWFAVFIVYVLAVHRIEGGVLGLLCLAGGLAAGRWWRSSSLPLAPRVGAAVRAGSGLRRAGSWLLWAYPVHLAALGALALTLAH